MRPLPTLVFSTAALFSSACMEYDLSSPKEPSSGGDMEEEEVPDDPPLEEACADDPSPQLLGFSPNDGQILDIDASVNLEAWVADAPASPADLTLEWFDGDGSPISSSHPDDDGYASVLWADPRPDGVQRLGLKVTDVCGNVAEQEISICQQASYHQEELALDSWHLEGDASMLDDGTLQLTGLNMWEIGSAFMVAQEVNAGEVDIRFEFLTEGGTGADGISLTALDLDRMTSFLGGSGCGLGYGGDIDCTDGPALPGWSIELDTWYNGELPDPTTDDHIAFSFDGQVAHPEFWAAVPDLEESGWHTVEVRVRAPQVTVSIDGRVYVDTEIDGNFDFPAVIGFTGSTGGQTNLHWIRSLAVTELACPDDSFDDDASSDDSSSDDSSSDDDWVPEDDEDTDADAVETVLVVSSDWGTGWCADVTVTNIGTGAALWTSRVPVDGTIDTIWSAEVVTDGAEWVFNGEPWNRSLEPGEHTSFGFCAER